MNQSEQINELATAMAKAQAEVEKAEKRGANPHFRSRYSDLGAVWDAIREPLTKHGLSVVQFPATDIENHCVVIRTRILHASGQWIEDALSVPVAKWDAQGIGSATTYGRRYSLMAVAGVAPEDDDGEAAVGRGKARTTKTELQKPEPLVTTEQAKELVSLLDKASADYQGFLGYFKVSDVAQLPASRFERAKKILDDKIKKKEAA